MVTGVLVSKTASGLRLYQVRIFGAVGSIDELTSLLDTFESSEPLDPSMRLVDELLDVEGSSLLGLVSQEANNNVNDANAITLVRNVIGSM
jgi:hypothetical protein